ncbi:hypothetical protein E2C01_038208 [Portunus trituberculatus]|uniref:Uncharacterized protein n=1 Tax=Portunus trituberculatus TaxID=210409 RepID=A0A5B7FHE9_PORTR|nr:hypothetical protein [Portunus trituberculatus]
MELLVKDLTEEFKEELVAVRQQCEGRTDVIETKVEKVQEEVTRVRRFLEKQSFGTWGRSEFSEPAVPTHPRSLVMSDAVTAGFSRRTCGTRLHPRMMLSPHHNLRHHHLSLDPPGMTGIERPGENTTSRGQFAWASAGDPGTHDGEPTIDINVVVEALRRRFGSVFQAEMYREQLKGRTRQQAIESLVRHVYPVAPEQMVTVLSQDVFLDTLKDQHVQIYVKQAHPADLQQALVRAMEFEAFLYTTTAAVTPHHRFAAQKPPRRHLPARRTQIHQWRRRCTSSAVRRDWPLYDATRPRDVYDHGGWRSGVATSLRSRHGGTLSVGAGFPGSECCVCGLQKDENAGM